MGCQLYSQTVRHIYGDMYEVVDYPARGFAFQLHGHSVDSMARLAVFKTYKSVSHTCIELIFTAQAMLVLYMPCSCVCLSLCLSQVGVLLKWLNIGIRKQRRMIAQGL